MRCPKCKHIFKSPGQKKGGENSKRTISKEEQAKMQAGRKKQLEGEVKNKTIIFLIALSIFATSYAKAGTIDRWSEPPRDIYFHAGGSALCTSTMGLYLKKRGQRLEGLKLTKKELKRSAMLKSFVFCTLLGVFKEYASDENPSQRELLLNLGGNVVGLFVIEFY